MWCAGQMCVILHSSMKILAIETSCDDTSLALVRASGGLRNPKFKIVKNLVSSQIKIHRPFGGVVPNLAKREHLKHLPLLFKKISSGKNLKVDAIAVTVGPGLEPALWTGIEFVKELSKTFKKPILPTSHLDGHLYSALLSKKLTKKDFPAVALIVSGGHTILLLVKDFAHIKKLGETVDDAAGEAFDKVARMLQLEYPGGPEVEKLAKKGNPAAIAFPRPMLNQKNYSFSFSGLKTSVLYYLRGQKLSAISSKLKANVAASFQKAAVDVLTKKTMRAVEEFGAKSVWLSGGVSANKALRNALAAEAKARKISFLVPDFEFNTDNAAMIAVAAYMNHLRKKKYPLKANGGLNF